MAARKMVAGFALFIVTMSLLGETRGEEKNIDPRALASFQEGKDLFKQMQYAEAAAKFREAYAFQPSWKLFYNIGQSEAAGKRHGLALEAFERFLSEGGDDIIETRRDEVLSEVERLRKIVGYLKITAPEGTVLMVDDVVRGTAPVLMALPVAMGIQHHVSGELDGETIAERKFRIAGGQTISMTLERSVQEVDQVEPQTPVVQPEEEEAAASEGDAIPTTPPSPMENTGSDSKKAKTLVVTGWTLSGVGAAAAVAGAALGGIALAKNREMSEECGSYCPEYEDDEQSVSKMGTAATALIAAGGTVFAAGVVTLFLGKKMAKKERRTVSVVPFVDNHTAAAVLDWQF